MFKFFSENLNTQIQLYFDLQEALQEVKMTKSDCN